MKKTILSGLIILLAFASCKKDFEETMTTAPTESAVARSQATNNWKTMKNWVESGGNYEASITDSTITAAVLSDGLVLLYINSGSIQLLPADVENTSFYYQAEEGSIRITANTTVEAGPAFSYVIFTKEELDKLEEKGVAKAALLKMDYQQAVDSKK